MNHPLIHSSKHAATTAALTATLCITTLSSASTAPRQMLHPDPQWQKDQTTQTQPAHSLLTSNQIAQLRAQGVDIELTKTKNNHTTLSMSSLNFVSPKNLQSIDHILNTTQTTPTTTPSLPFHFQRNTNLNDGNIAGNTPSLPNSNSNPDAIATMTQSEGSYNFYEMAYEWQAASTKQVHFTIISGITAIQANVSKRVHSGDTTDIYDATNRVVTVPTIGSAIRWNISDTFSFKGQATTQSLNMGSSLLEFNAQTDWKISDRVDLIAGYQILRSQIDLGPVTSDLNQQGLFARLQIKF